MNILHALQDHFRSIGYYTEMRRQHTLAGEVLEIKLANYTSSTRSVYIMLSKLYDDDMMLRVWSYHRRNNENFYFDLTDPDSITNIECVIEGIYNHQFDTVLEDADDA